MGKKKKSSKKNNTPRRKRMKRAARLDSAKEWIKSYTGKDIIKGYAKWYGQDEVCAITELRMLGIDISEERLIKAKEKIEQKAEIRRKQREKKQEEQNAGCDFFANHSDEHFYFIAGYTTAGFPFGITWEEAENDETFRSHIEEMPRDKS